MSVEEENKRECSWGGDGGVCWLVAERETARLVILITRQNMDLTSWPQPSHMMGFGNEPITLTDADEFSQSCWRWCSRFNARRTERSTGLCYFLMKNNVEYIFKRHSVTSESEGGAREGQM